MNQEQNMKRKLRVLALILAPALIFAACDSPTSDTKASEEEGVRYSVGVNGVIITTDDLERGVREALQRSIENGDTRDGKTPATAIDVSLGGGDLRFSNEDSMVKLFRAVEDYCVNLDLQAVRGSQILYWAKLDPINKSKILSVSLSDFVTRILNGTATDSVFEDFTGLKSITAPGLLTVGNYAFNGCVGLTTVNLPEVTNIGDYAFNGCVGLTSVSFPVATTLGTAAFNGTGLTTVNLPEATNIGAAAFQNCVGLTTVNLPEATIIQNNAFTACTSLTTVNLPKVENIAYSAFRNAGIVPLTITLGVNKPILGITLFIGVSAAPSTAVKSTSP